ncbi:hypothetical protein BGW80DRAFT_623877 [Lactifluus volemus]|nr:hypothetical protein BGW80DRAFT_623877 [Lactifluus volemus]
MANLRSPNVSPDMRAMAKFWHAQAVDGILLWEFVTTLDFEWSIIRGNRPYHWTIWIYSLMRLAALMAVILDMIELDVYTPINCQLGIIFELIFSYLTLACASLLLMLCVVAIWKRNKIILTLATTVWMTSVAFLIQGIVRIRSVWTSEEGCLVSNSDIAKLNFIVTLATYTILLLMMLAGLLYLRLEGGGVLSLGDFLWKQGVIWFLLAAVAEVPPAVFLFLNLNESFNLMFQIPALIVLAIAATRIYRALIDFSSDTYSLLTLLSSSHSHG